jgi:hypothetical protein
MLEGGWSRSKHTRKLGVCCCLITRMQGKNYDIRIANRSFENVTQFKYLGMTVTNQNLIHGEIKRRLIEFEQCLLPFSPEPRLLICCLKM